MSSTTSKFTESSSDASKDVDQQTPREEAPDQSKNGGEEASDQSKKGGEEADQIEATSGGDGGEAGEDEEEEGECGFCLFMKGGGCKDTFTDWEKCVEEADKTGEDVVEKCFEVTSNLKKCMEAHADYYEPILRAEKAAEEEVTKEMQREAAEKQTQDDSTALPEKQVNSS